MVVRNLGQARVAILNLMLSNFTRKFCLFFMHHLNGTQLSLANKRKSIWLLLLHSTIAVGIIHNSQEQRREEKSGKGGQILKELGPLYVL